MNFGIRYEKVEPHVCCVLGCPNSSELASSKSLKISYYSFPLTTDERLAWLEAIPALKTDIKSTNINASTKVCSAHFDPEQFEETTVRGFRRLKKTALPCLFYSVDSDESSQEDRTNKKAFNVTKDFKSVFENQLKLTMPQSQSIITKGKKTQSSKATNDLDSSDEEKINNVMYKSKVPVLRNRTEPKLDDLTEEDCTPEEWAAYAAKLADLENKNSYIEALVERITDNTKHLETWLKLVRKSNAEIRKRQKLVVVKGK